MLGEYNTVHLLNSSVHLYFMYRGFELLSRNFPDIAKPSKKEKKKIWF